MKKTLILASALALVLSGSLAVMADEQKAQSGTPAATTVAGATGAATTTAPATKQEVTLKCVGVDATNATTVQSGFSKADGVFAAKVDAATGKVICQIDPAKTNAEKLLAFAKNNKWNCTK